MRGGAAVLANLCTLSLMPWSAALTIVRRSPWECPSGDDCRVDCKGDDRCKKRRISIRNGPSGYVHVVCDGEDACKDLELDCGHVRPPGGCSVECKDDDACKSIRFRCPDRGGAQCQIDCGRKFKDACDKGRCQPRDCKRLDDQGFQTPTYLQAKPPTRHPTARPPPPSRSPVAQPTRSPTRGPATSPPTRFPSKGPTAGPTPAPAAAPSAPPSAPPRTAPPSGAPLGPSAAPAAPTAPPLGPTAPPVPPSASPLGPTLHPLPPSAAPRSPSPAPSRHPIGPSAAPAQPTAPPRTPTAAPTAAPLGPTRAPAPPTVAPEGPTGQPAQPTGAPLGPTQPPEQPTGSPLGPTRSPEQPTRSPLGPTRSPEQPTGSPADPTRPPEVPTGSPLTAPPTAPPLTPTSPPVPPTAPPLAPTPLPSPAPSPAPSGGPSTPPTAAPSFHPCTDGSHGCDKGPGGVCIVATGNTWQCNCSAGYVCVAGCSSHTAHSCVPLTGSPTAAPSRSPSAAPSRAPSAAPSAGPSAAPTRPPSAAPSGHPSRGPSLPPTAAPSTTAPTQEPSAVPSSGPSARPSRAPTGAPSASSPSGAPSASPTRGPSLRPSAPPSGAPQHPPSRPPSAAPSAVTFSPTAPSMPPTAPSHSPSARPSALPSGQPTAAEPTRPPATAAPSAAPSAARCAADEVGPPPNCRRCSSGRDCGGRASNVTAVGGTCMCTCALRSQFPGYAAVASEKNGGDPIFVGPRCEACGPSFVSPHCWSCTAKGNCSRGAVSAEVEGAACLCRCHKAYKGDSCAECATGYEAKSLAGGGTLCVTARSVRLSHEVLESEWINSGEGVELTITLEGDTFTPEAVQDVGHPGALVALSSDHSADMPNMAHAFQGSLADHVNGRQPDINASANQTFIESRLDCDDPGPCNRMVIKFGPWSSFSRHVSQREVITVRFAPEAFHSASIGWEWEDAVGSFQIRHHHRTFAAASSVKAVVAGGGAALTAGAPTGAGKLALIADLADCPSDRVPGAEDDEDHGFTENPLMLALGGSHTRHNFGASVANTVIVLPSIALLHFLLVVANWQLRSRVFDSRATFIGSMGQMMFPCWLVLPTLLFYQGTLEAALRVLFYGEVGYKMAAFPVAVLFTFGLPYLVYRQTSPQHLRGIWVPYDRMDTCPRKALFGATTWESFPHDPGWVDRWGCLFWDFKEKYKRFLIYDVGSLVVLSALGAWQPADQTLCELKIALVALLFLLCAVVALWCRPFIALYDLIFYVAVNLLECVSVMCAFVMTAKGLDADVSAEEQLGGVCLMAVTYMLITQTIIDFSIFCFETYEDWREKRNEKSTKKGASARQVSAKQLPVFQPGEASLLEASALGLGDCAETSLLELQGSSCIDLVEDSPCLPTTPRAARRCSASPHPISPAHSVRGSRRGPTRARDPQRRVRPASGPPSNMGAALQSPPTPSAPAERAPGRRSRAHANGTQQARAKRASSGSPDTGSPSVRRGSGGAAASARGAAGPPSPRRGSGGGLASTRRGSPSATITAPQWL
eukprot:TRINITY_DN3369_c0_g4_i2.p1 TRINITY_DN3369_c0_g4~~TRINITY_DN3369_c0_g4_i2.p1  ORF type:complete len:1553 (+),score=315.36 TRINITY_DN3369_c0_g4_i2:79-4659(+)